MTQINKHLATKAVPLSPNLHYKRNLSSIREIREISGSYFGIRVKAPQNIPLRAAAGGRVIVGVATTPRRRGKAGGLLTKGFYIQAAPFDVAFEGAKGYQFAAVHGHNNLTAIFMTPFLMAASLPNHDKTMPTKHFDNLLGIANWKPAAHDTANSINFAPLLILTGDGANHRARASLALTMASASVSPALAHPGNSGNTADQRPASGSNSTNKRSFMFAK
jgi:hypothetical protein